MKKVLGIIIEYNPFHNGHLYHLEQAKKAAGCDYVVGVMSGNYVQRGEPAILNKWARSEIALNHGVDVLVELPTVYAIQSAEGFALGSVHLLENTGIVTDLVFGSEAGETVSLINTAQDLLDLEKNPQLIKDSLKEGISYSEAMAKLVNSPDVLNGSNNILALEYIKTILKHNINIKVDTIKRLKNEYNNNQLPKHSIASATALRPHIKDVNDKDIASYKYRKYMPPRSYEKVLETLYNTQKPGNLNDMSQFFFNLVYREGVSKLRDLHRMEVGLENRFFSACAEHSHSLSLDGFLENVSTKRYSKSRISRLVMQFMLGLESQLIERSNEVPGGYLKILGCSTNGVSLLKDIKKHSSVPHSLNFNKLIKDFPVGSLGREQLEFETRATNMYTNFFYKKPTQQLEYYHKCLIKDC